MPKILVVDDSVVIRKVAELMLKEAGFEVVLATSAEDALAFLEKERPDAIVTDISMPGKNGYEICSFVRSQSALASTPVLIISGVVNDEVIKQAASCRADGVLRKPFQGTALKDRVLELLTKQQSQAQTAAPQAGPTPGGTGADSAQLTARLKELEAGLEQERGKVARLSERLKGFEQESSRFTSMEADLASERNKSAQLASQLEQATNRLKEVEAQLASERDRMKTRVEELEATVTVERDAAAQIIQRMEKTKDKPSQP